MARQTVSKGLAGVIAAETSISTVGVKGAGLSYRGYSIEDLAEGCVNFEETAYLLLRGWLPNKHQLEMFQDQLCSNRILPSPLKKVLEQLPQQAHPMDVLRTGVSVLGSLESEILDTNNQTTVYSEEGQYKAAVRLMGMYAPMLFYWHNFHKTGMRIQTNTESKSLSRHFFELLSINNPELDNIPEEYVRTLDASLILYAEHDLNASTFAARVTAATLSDIHSAICSAIGTLKGPLHGGANEAAMALLQQMTTEKEADHILTQLVKEKKLIMGFGHRIYKDGDPRSNIIKKWSQRLSLLPSGNPQLFKVSEYAENWMTEKKGIYPNLDYYSASAYHQCKIPTSFFTPLFVIARTAGWAAHIMEQRSNNRLIRPSSAYVGELRRAFVPLSNRTSPRSEQKGSESVSSRL